MTDDQDSLDRVATMRACEEAAELVSVYQADLLTQVEAQSRAVRHTAISINRLRDSQHCVGPEPNNEERLRLLSALAKEFAAIDRACVDMQQSCTDAQQLVRQMQARLQVLQAQLGQRSGGEAAE